MSISNQKPVGKSETVLIVDDNLQTAEFIDCLLSDSGFSTKVADSGQRALEIVKGGGIDLALLDVVMPDVDGITLSGQIKSIASGGFLPVIMVTALAAAEDKVAGLIYADDYLTKPFSGDELIARINSLLRIRRLNNQLSDAKARFECLYEHFPHLYVSIDSRRNITNCNLFFRQTFNLSREEIVGRSIFSVVYADDHPVLEHFLNTLATSCCSQIFQRNFRLLRPSSQEPMTVNMKAAYIGEEEAGLSVVIAMEDLTEQLKLQEEQKIARMQLYRSARLASIGNLASGVAHELNNPLTAILGFTSALLDRMKKPEDLDKGEFSQYLTIINSEALRCRDIVENLTKFAREGEFLSARISLHECITDALKLLNPKLVRNSINVINEIQPGVEVRAEARKLEQVFVNVLSNCIDFCGPGSTVVIAAGYSREPSKYFAVSIGDNGPGIAPEDLTLVFDPFFTTKEVGRGTGMGLAICHKIMEESNGSIDIQSEIGKGTTVVLEIPLGRELVDRSEP